MTPGHDREPEVSGEGLRSELWLHASNYDYTRHLTRRGWAWEFLRRNKHYVLDWGVAQSEVMMLPGQGSPVTLRLGASSFRMWHWGLIFRRRT